ncbi:unnamed protein product [Adineta ricciae]|uniref:Secreted protein n=1 Tax=Adineta ricciae TaxID=249248 RepID=A0A813RGP5_ADIRI|nr:unnamed protein product [Adineta ricciae]
MNNNLPFLLFLTQLFLESLQTFEDRAPTIEHSRETTIEKGFVGLACHHYHHHYDRRQLRNLETWCLRK